MVRLLRSWHPGLPSLREVYHATFDHAYPKHTHDVWTVMLIDDGAVAYSLDRTDHHATRNTLSLLPPGVPHDGRSATDGKSYRKRVLYLETTWLPEPARGLAARAPSLTNREAREAARRVHAALRTPGDLMVAEHWLLAVREFALAHLGTSTRRSRDAPLARRLRALLDDRVTESFTVAAAAAELNAHPSHLVRTFSLTYGIAPYQYIVGRRVELARHLLASGHRPADAAALAGFHDQPHLTRHFRRVLGITPAAFVASMAD
ncbi:AraC-like DNA-binding protein [Microbacterium trichothecenolyticum]|uniref:helix-turn-helix transcriptional regulator n=1 Tax=Microbacterium trichothecenolyticum TaxID=69370 RepID=UPI0028629DF9|nr:AraC family transcriptional regulator [Microbacterium trichothecenolyticum]MDR7186809.1 AraC-like DNA-binding protein [Microbacterium trichothecenolyticum]